MKGKYIYRGQDITLDVLMKIEHVVRILSEREGREFDDMYQDFLGSKTYAALKKMESLLWAESAEFIAKRIKTVKENIKSKDGRG